MNFEFVLFAIDPSTVRAAASAGIDAILVDWESKGKRERQQGANTEINYHTLEDLRRTRKETRTALICRLNRFFSGTKQELEQAIEAGADEVLLPMVKTATEVEQVLKWSNGRTQVGMLIETNAAIQQAEPFSSLPLSRVFVGLNDLAIERKAANIFLPLIDGSIEKIRPFFTVPFGFGGLTLPGLGFPIPCALLVQEMIRLRCSFSFMRRSFLKDIQGRSMAIEIPLLRAWIQSFANRPSHIVMEDQQRLIQVISSLGQV